MAKSTISKLETIRQNGKTQLDAQRAHILDTAEQLFLEKGLDHTTMTDLATQAGITRMSLYRYFPDRDPIAFEIAIRMLKKIGSLHQPVDPGDVLDESTLLAYIKTNMRTMIHNFYPLRDAYRYIGMFDHLYGDHYPTEVLAKWYKEHMLELDFIGLKARLFLGELRYSQQLVIMLNTIMSFLEKMAARGELMASEQEVSLDDQLRLFDEMVSFAFDQWFVSMPPQE